MANLNISSDSSPAITPDPSLESKPAFIEFKLFPELNLSESSSSQIEISLFISSKATQKRIRYKRIIIIFIRYDLTFCISINSILFSIQKHNYYFYTRKTETV